MSVLSAVKDLLQAPANRSDPTAEPAKGAYWCHDCSERIRDTAVEGDEPPACPDRGDAMTFERSRDSAGRAC